MNFGCKRRVGRFLCLLAVGFWLPVLAGTSSGAMESKNSSGKKVTLQFQGMEIVEVLKILAEEAGFNVAAGKNVSGRVNLFVKEVDPWEVLEVILKSNDLAYERQGQILSIVTRQEYETLHGMPFQDRRVLRSVAPRYSKAGDLGRALAQVKSNIGRVISDEATNTLILMDSPDLVEQMVKLASEMDQPLETRVFSLNHGSVKTLGPALQDAVTKNLGKLLLDERTNRIVVTDTPDSLERIARVVEAFDARSMEVFIDAKILQVSLSDKFQLGIDWEVLARENITVKGPNALNLTSGGSLKIAQAALNGAGDYKTLVEALRTFGSTRILSEPRLMVVNNQEAKILVGSKEPYVTTQISQTGTGTAVTAEAVNFIDVGVKMHVTPAVTRDGFVQMKIRPEISSKTGVLTTSQKNEIPIVESTEAETVLIVEDGGTVILGGLIKDENSLDEQRIPLLGDIPILGLPFRSTKKTVKRTELVVFLTPHIVTGQRNEPAPEPDAGDSPRDESAYRDALIQRIQAVAGVQASAEGVRGSADVSFMLTPDGHLKNFPEVTRADKEELRRLAKQAVFVASPFPAFPPELGKEPRSFQVAVRYE